jgi:hypothetical protein
MMPPFLAFFQSPSSRLAAAGDAGHVGHVLALLATLASLPDASSMLGAGVLGRGHAGGGAAVDAVHDHGVDGVVVTNLLNRLAKYTLLLNFWC